MTNQDPARQEAERAAQRRARILGLNYFDTSTDESKPLYPSVLPYPEIESLKIVPLRADEHAILFGVTNNTSRQTMSNLKHRFTDQQLSFALISDIGFSDYGKLYNPPKKVVYEDVSLLPVAPEAAKAGGINISSTLEQVRADDVLAYLVKQAYQLKASDIHLETQRETVRVRLRVDGVLHTVAQLSKEKYRQFLSVVAVAANISTSADSSQTGHISKSYQMATGEAVTVNLRVESLPVVYGQDIVMRLFNFDLSMFNLDRLGLNKTERGVVDEVVKHPNGMVMVVGPTGSGKTTTLYSIVNSLNTDQRKIITLEDPVEYDVPGVIQVPVKGSQLESEFASKLRSVLRLDPDVIMIGEIRDQDTAKTALQAALTGHLVLATFHANSAAAALTRMLDAIGINPLFASAIHLVMAQRLVRKLDDSTKQAYEPDSELKLHIQKALDKLPTGVDKPDLEKMALYKPGSSTANPFGYKGQIALREQLQMTHGVQKILKLPQNEITTEMIEDQAKLDGMLTMEQDGLLKALAGETSVEEVYRVIG